MAEPTETTVTVNQKMVTPPIWIPETRTVIVCWMMVSSFFIIVLIWAKPSTGADSQLLNTLIGMYVGTGFISTINWWMGDSKGSDVTNKMQDKMADAIRPASLPVPPVVVVAWWSLLTDAEKTAIQASTDPKVLAFVSAAASGKATVDDIKYLVTVGLLTPERANAIQST